MKITRRQLRQIIREAPVRKNKKYSLLEACGCGETHQPEDTDVNDKHADIDFESPGTGHIRGNIDDMNPRDAFLAGFVMGQSGDFDDLITGTMSDAHAGGDNLENPVDYALVASGESNAGPHNLMALEEQQSFMSSDEIESELLDTLSSEGGAAGIDALRSKVNDLSVPDNFDLESFLANSEKIERHPDGDYLKAGSSDIAEMYELPERMSLAATFVDAQPMLIGKPTIDTTGLSQPELWARMAGIKLD